MTNSIQVFNFQGDDLEVVRQGDDVFVSLRAVCDALGVDVENQRRKLAEKEWASTATIKVVVEQGVRQQEATTAVIKTAVVDFGSTIREVVGVHLDTLPLWLTTISPSKVAEGVRPKLVAYQKQAAGVLADHFLGRRGGASPQVMEDTMRKVLSEALGGQQGTPRLQGPLGSKAALRATIEWARNAAHTFTIRKGRDYKWPDSAAVIGMWTSEDVAIVRTTLDLLVTAWGFEPAELYAAWTRAGWAHVDKQAKVFGIRRSGGRAHCVVIRRAGWEAAGFDTCPAGDLS